MRTSLDCSCSLWIHPHSNIIGRLTVCTHQSLNCVHSVQFTVDARAGSCASSKVNFCFVLLVTYFDFVAWINTNDQPVNICPFEGTRGVDTSAHTRLQAACPPHLVQCQDVSDVQNFNADLVRLPWHSWKISTKGKRCEWRHMHRTACCPPLHWPCM